MLSIIGGGTGAAATLPSPELRPGDGNGAFARQLKSSPPAPSARMSTVAGLAASPGLLALQELRSPGPRRRRSMARGQAILDGLDELGLALLEDSDPIEIASRLRSRLDAGREHCEDATLGAILDAIDLRAQVELAKLECRVGHDIVPER